MPSSSLPPASHLPLRFAVVLAPGEAESRSGPRQRLPFRSELEVGEGDFVGLHGGTVVEVLARGGSARAALYAVAAEQGLDPYFDAAVLAETGAHLAHDASADGSLVDLSAMPFVTIDGPHSRDLDQAIFVEREGDGYVVHYALADAAHFAPRGSALFADAMRRGASIYFPGFAIPMLPRPLSEGLVSLNPDGPRRALLFSVHLDARGERIHTELRRARIHSRRKLAWGQVQQLYDAPAQSPLAATELAPSLLLLREVGEVLLDRADSRDLVRFHREEVEVSLDSEGLAFVVTRAVRERVELYNEQISLLVNGEGALLLREHPSPDVEPIYRIHPAPDAERLEQLRATIAQIVAHHGLPDRYEWKRGSSLARYIAALPRPDDPAVSPGLRRITRVLERQAIVANLRSRYVTEPGEHFGVGLDPYGRFTAPMREIVGVFLHGETVEAFGLLGDDPRAPRDVMLRDRVVEAGNRSRELQRSITDAGNRLVIDRLFRGDLERPLADRPLRRATVMGLAKGKVHVTLESPSLDLKLYLRELGKVLGGAWLVPDPNGISLLVEKTGQVLFSVGDAITLRTVELDRGTDRWVLEPQRLPEEP